MSDSATRTGDQPERRRAARLALRLNATIREPGRSRDGVRVIDISTHGCRVEANACTSADSWVMLSIAGLETQYCRVVWHRDNFAGLEFANPLTEPVLEQLLHGQQHLSEATIGELRDIAKRTHRLATADSSGHDETLAEFSRECAVEALLAGLRLSETQNQEPPATRK